ncbi:GNAT family N-acetyltransferase [Fodinicola acaciae]|uniref:GNAT family N-acetyltransferase n=1 Tax=Fodinicola acaciae TaxID=2681555 RepID=UPI0013D42F76|nr:GNAT family N-acetyltransferase [Fodinicola acaciae]
MDSTLVVNRVSARQWHALEDDLVVGRGDVSRRPDGRVFVSVDAWHPAVFDQLAAVLLAELPRPLYTVVDEDDVDLTCGWERAGFVARRREWEYVLATDPRLTGLDVAVRPPDLTIGAARERPVHALYRAIREEVDAAVGWQEMPAEVLSPLHDVSAYAVATLAGRDVGLVRVAPLTRRPRVGLIAVLAAYRRRGIARAMLAHALDSLHRNGIQTASADINAANHAALALFEGIGARRAGSNLELVHR